MEQIADHVVQWFNRKVEDYVYLGDNERRVAMIIGADNAVGFCLAKKLVRKNYHLIMGVKSTKVGMRFVFDYMISYTCRMKRKLIKMQPYSRITILSVDMSNPMDVFNFANRIRNLVKRIDVLYLNSSVVNIESMDWNVMYEALRSRALRYVFTTER